MLKLPEGILHKNFTTTHFLFLSLFLLLISPLAHAQQGLIRTDLISPSPTVANLAKYGEIPVTYYTGMPNVSIPIFTVTGNELSVPITLSYNFNGHVPAQKASWVGLGWSLQAGGVITRTAQDKVELTSQGYDRDSAMRINPSQHYLTQSFIGTYDNLPDLYSFNFGNYSGKFVLYNNQAYLMPDQNLKITGGPGGFTIVTDDGTQYLFQEIELTTPRNSEGGFYDLPTHASAWHLSKITNASNTESIRFYYESDGTALQYGIKTQTYLKLIEKSGADSAKVDPPLAPFPPSDVFPTKVAMKRLSSIVSDKYTVTFSAVSVREDFEMETGSSRSLGSIVISACNGGLVKRLDLDYGYFGSGPANYKYLKLKSLTDRGLTSGDSFMKHQFEYYNETSPFGTGTMSTVDKFGYLMGDGFMPNNMYISTDVWPWGTNREPLLSGAETGALKKITYPTGGSTTFTYELNRAIKDRSYVAYDTSVLAQVDRGSPSTTTILSSTNTFTITYPQEVVIWFSRTPKIPWDSTNIDAPVEVDHDNIDEVELAQFSAPEPGPHGPVEQVGAAFWTGRIVLNRDNTGKSVRLMMEPGKYQIKAVCDGDENQVAAVVTYRIQTNIPDPGIAAPGIRLRELTNDSGFGATLTKRFSYLDDEGFSTGQLLRSNHYSASEYTESYHALILSSVNAVWTNKFLSHTSVVAETHGIGLPLYYAQVREETVASDLPNDVLRSDYFFEYFNGTKSVELMKKVDYRKNGAAFSEHVKQENFFSADYFGEAFGGGNVRIDTKRMLQAMPEIYDYIFKYDLQIETVYWKHPTLSRVTTQEGGRTMVTETKSFFDVNGSRNLIGSRTTLSDGSSLYTKYKYAEDYAGVASVTPLVSANLVGKVIEEQVWRKNPAGDSSMISGKLNVYSGMRLASIYVFESAQGVASLTSETKDASGKYTTLVSDSRYKKKIDFTYDAYGHVISQQPTDHEPISIIWGYDALTLSSSPIASKVYPIAEIKNAKPDSVFHTSFEDSSGAQMQTVTGRKAKQGPYVIPSSFTGKYTLSYWIKTGAGAWTLVQQPVTNPSSVSIGDSNSYLDEVRLIPAKATITTYTYQPEFGISTVTDANNSVSYFEYDALGRLRLIRDKDGNVVKAYNYHIKDEQITPAVE